MRAGMKLALMMAVLVAPALRAQDPHFGLGLNLSIPVGDLNSRDCPADDITTVPHRQGYDPGMGLQFTISFPVDPHVAFRLELVGQSESGTDTAPGYETYDLDHTLFGIAGEVQIFPGSGSAYRHKGTYLLGGVSADFERFEIRYRDAYYDDYYDDYRGGLVDSQRKSRMGVLMGMGHSFTYNSWGRFTMELAYHKTVTGHDVSIGEPVAADFLRLGFGWVF
jgi:hypothetical protein